MLDARCGAGSYSEALQQGVQRFCWEVLSATLGGLRSLNRTLPCCGSWHFRCPSQLGLDNWHVLLELVKQPRSVNFEGRGKPLQVPVLGSRQAWHGHGSSELGTGAGFRLRSC